MDYKFEKCQAEFEFWLERGGNVKYLIDVAAGRLLRDLFAHTSPANQDLTTVSPRDRFKNINERETIVSHSVWTQNVPLSKGED